MANGENRFIVMLDTILFENWQQVFIEAHEWREMKYQSLVETLRIWGYEVIVKALIFRVLGA